MENNKILELIRNVRIIKTEDSNLELKKASGGPPKIYDTLSAFANQNIGGKILFGINEENNFSIDGVYDVKDLIEKIIKQCDEMEPTIKPIITSAIIENKNVVLAEIPSTDYMFRPVYRKALGINGGAFVRVGSFDRHMSQAEIYSYYSYKNRINDDTRVINDVNGKLIDQKLLDEYLVKIKKEKPNLANNVSNDEILEIGGIKKDGKYTLSGVLVFSKFPQQYFPQLCITAVKIYEDYIDKTSNERFEDNVKITGNIGEMLNGAIEFIKRNIKIKTIINSDGKRADESEYPMIAIREAILNTLVHRDYSIHSEGIPTSITIYNNKIVIVNPGSLYGNIDVSMLGKVHINARNKYLSDILETLDITENRYSGVPTIYNEFKRRNLQTPKFESLNGEFKIELFNKQSEETNVTKRVSEEKSKSDKEFEIIKFCEVPRTRQELIDFVGKNKYYTINVIVKKLLERGELVLTIPEKPKSPFQKYVVNKELLENS